jgi:imidazolonepropionase-like amidohydrolase
MPSALLTLYAAKNARLVLEAGFTTVRDLAGIPNKANVEVLALKHAIELGLVAGPQILVAGWVGQTAGHLDMIPPFTWHREPNATADGPWEIRKLARTYLRQGVDLLKTSASGGFGPIEDFTWRNYTVQELEALADEAHAAGKRLAAHVDSAQGIKNAIRAGVDTLEHCTYADDEAIQLMVEHGVYMIPTLTLGSDRTIQACRQTGTYSDAVLQKLRMIGEAAQRTFKRAHQAGVKIVTGTDIYRSMPDQYGKNAYELELMVQYGMSPMEAIVASTSMAAEALGISDRIGTIEPGKLADMLVVDGNPLNDIRILQDSKRVLAVLKGGQIVVDRRTSRNTV